MSFEIPILILAWKRPDKLKILLSKLKEFKPKKLYISIDGPNDDAICKKKVDDSKNIVKTTINWKCDLKRKYEKNNLGCKKGVSGGISWLFNYEKEGIILEEDCIPNLSFFYFVENMLEKYKNNKNIFSITGDCFIKNKNQYEETYYFSKYPHCWGWATWKDRWASFDGNINFWPNLKKSKKWKNIHPDYLERLYWNKIMNKVYNNEIDSWAYPWAASIWNSNGITVTPMLNLVSNIGFENDGTHTLDEESKLSNLPKFKLNKFIGPKYFERNISFDKECFYSTFFVVSFKKIFGIIKNFLYKLISRKN